MSPLNYILLMILGWLLLAAAMLWAMLRLTSRYHHQSHPAQQLSETALSANPAGHEQHSYRRARLRERGHRSYLLHAQGTALSPSLGH